jgi:ATP:corrinoid adenosyltransferase
MDGTPPPDCCSTPTGTRTLSDERHAEKMRKKQAAHEKIMASKTHEKGLLIVHTGKGKGIKHPFRSGVKAQAGIEF